MRLNSFSLFVTSVIPSEIACATIDRSIAPITLPFCSRLALRAPYANAALSSKGRMVMGDKNFVKAN